MKELETALRRYKLDDLLFLLAEKSRCLYRDRTAIEEKRQMQRVGPAFREQTILLPAWILADLSYLSIKHSNDYRSAVPSEQDIYRLKYLIAKAQNDVAGEKLRLIPDEDIKTHILLGLSQKQFWYQEIVRNLSSYYNFLRYYVLLNEMPLLFSGHRQPSDDLSEITGFNIRAFSQLLMAGWALTVTTSLVTRTEVSPEVTERIPVITEENLKRCLSFFAADYRYYRKSKIAGNPLFLRPIVRTDSGNWLISNSFIWAKKFYEGIYWILRDQYREWNSGDFLTNFGKYYEKYVEKMLEYYLAPGQFEKVEENKSKKRADWIIHSESYVLLVEQKSCLMTIALKEEYPALSELDRYLNNFEQAYLQLEQTLEAIAGQSKQVIKLVLHFERFYLADSIFKERLDKRCKAKISDLRNYFLIDTEEFESLIQLLSTNESKFNEVMGTKIQYDVTPPPISEGREFKNIMDKHRVERRISFLDSYDYAFEGLFGSIE